MVLQPMNKCNSIYNHTKCTASTRLIFKQLTTAQQHYMQHSCNEFHLKWIYVEIGDKNSFMPISKVWLSLFKFLHYS